MASSSSRLMRRILMCSLICACLVGVRVLTFIFVQKVEVQGLENPNLFNSSRSGFQALLPRQNIWADLTESELDLCVRWLSDHKEIDENETKTDLSDRTSNQLLITELLRPNKSEVIAFLDESNMKPPRYARVTVQRSQHSKTDIVELMLGPLEDGAELNVSPLRYPYNSGRSSTGHPTPNVRMLLSWIDGVVGDIKDVIGDLLGSAPYGFRQLHFDSFEVVSNDAILYDGDRQMRWFGFSQKSNASTLLPQPLYFKADTTGVNASGWSVVAWLYNDKMYDNTSDFRTAWESGQMAKLPPNLDGVWTKLEPDHVQPSQSYWLAQSPILSTIGGVGLDLDKIENFVSWKGFSFNIAFSQVSGVSLFDIRLDGERIVYELTLQDAVAYYASWNPIQSGTAFLDSLFGFGSQLSELIPGFDCPDHAEFLDMKYHRLGQSFEKKASVCIFEFQTDYPLQRHLRGNVITSFKNSVLIVRSISTIGNYDYLIDYIFYLDGAIEIKFRASGYIQGAYYAKNSSYGYRVHDQFSSSIHDHVLHFKADLDIAGRYNNFTIVTLKPADVVYPWSSGAPRDTMLLEQKQVLSEDEGRLYWASNGAKAYIVTGAENRYGVPRGYRIMPGTGIGSPVHLTVKNSSLLGRAGSWAEYDLFITRQKDTEPWSARPANAFARSTPLVDFQQFFDGERTADEDLVVWFNLGVHHIPHTGDIPNTLMTTSASSVMLVPHNYHVHDRSRQLTNSTSFDLSRNGTS